jgi:hypothetical protein
MSAKKSPSNLGEVPVDADGKIELKDLLNVIANRISVLRQSIKNEELVIVANVGFSNIVSDAVDRIKDLEASIQELTDFIKLRLGNPKRP